MNRLLHRLQALVVLTALALGISCETSQEADNATRYGYVQFKVVKASMLEEQTRATDALNWLSDAHKIRVVMQHEGSTITQTLPLSSYDNQSAEWGLRSEKLQLIAGSYNIIGYYIYDNLDQELISGGASGEFIVEQGGLTVKPVGVEVVERGKVTFRLTKEFTRAEHDYSFASIRSIDICVRNKFSGATTTLEKLEVVHREDVLEGVADPTLGNGDYYVTAYAECNTESWLEAGNYVVTSYTTYSDKDGKRPLETASLADYDVEFAVSDNHTTRDVELPILLLETAANIADYMALKAIWSAMDGPNWSFHGEEYSAGTNWNFNKDIDLWGQQPGVSLDGSGRVVGLNLSGFGARGVVPEAIGELTELRLLYLGNHNELIGGYDSSQNERIDALDYHRQMLEYDAREALSPELREVINRDSEQRPILSSRAERKDVAFGNFTNGITGISRAMMRLVKLEQFFIANSPITPESFFVELDSESKYADEASTWSWTNFTALSDVEIYNCPNLDRLPIELLTLLPNIQSLNLSLNRNISGEQIKADWEAIIDGNSGATIQILYLGFNNLRETPSHDYLKRMSKLGYLDCTNNQLRVVHPFGKEVSLVTVYLDNNRIERLYAAEDGYFCGLSQMETLSCNNNLLTELPDIFTARSVHVVSSVSFSHNQIASLENGSEWRGINTATLNLSNNRLTTLPPEILGSGSIIETLVLSGNGMRSIAPGAMIGRNSATLTTIDLSFNRLSEIPYTDFSAENLPYLYGIDLSSNAFSAFPYAPLSIDRLTVMSIRQQRDDEGNRTLREWPTGIGTCPRMAAFYIGSNDLRNIEDTISPYILLFEIKDNPNISIDLSNVCPYIEMGYYELIYDSTQDIRGCDALNLD